MSKIGGQPGNQNAAKSKRWAAAIDRALERRYEKNASLRSAQQALDELAEKLLEKAEDGEGWALKELGDRIEGKAAQSLTVLGDEESPLEVVTRVEIVPLVNKKD